MLFIMQVHSLVASIPEIRADAAHSYSPFYHNDEVGMKSHTALSGTLDFLVGGADSYTSGHRVRQGGRAGSAGGTGGVCRGGGQGLQGGHKRGGTGSAGGDAAGGAHVGQGRGKGLHARKGRGVGWREGARVVGWHSEGCRVEGGRMKRCVGWRGDPQGLTLRAFGILRARPSEPLGFISIVFLVVWHGLRR